MKTLEITCNEKTSQSNLEDYKVQFPFLYIKGGKVALPTTSIDNGLMTINNVEYLTGDGTVSLRPRKYQLVEEGLEYWDEVYQIKIK